MLIKDIPLLQSERENVVGHMKKDGLENWRLTGQTDINTLDIVSNLLKEHINE